MAKPNPDDYDKNVERVAPSDMNEGDKVLWGDRKQPCEVVDVTEYDGPATTKAEVETPRGKTRELRRHRPPGRNPRNETNKPYSVADPDANPSQHSKRYVWEFFRVVDAGGDADE